jgi:lactate dehydrogenase-like 2-hydroxyacid dehydrogenase
MGPSPAFEDRERFVDVKCLFKRGALLSAATGSGTISVAEGTLAPLLAVNLGLVMAKQVCKVGKAGLIWQRTHPTL